MGEASDGPDGNRGAVACAYILYSIDVTSECLIRFPRTLVNPVSAGRGGETPECGGHGQKGCDMVVEGKFHSFKSGEFTPDDKPEVTYPWGYVKVWDGEGGVLQLKSLADAESVAALVKDFEGVAVGDSVRVGFSITEHGKHRYIGKLAK